MTETQQEPNSPMNRSTRAGASIAGLALLLVACGTGDASPADGTSTGPTAAASEATSEAPDASAAPGGEEATVTLEAFAFDTDALTIAAGTTVSFVNADTADHTVTEGADGVAADDPIVDEEVAANATATFTFDEAGTYEITCLLHPDMNMTITVEG